MMKKWMLLLTATALTLALAACGGSEGGSRAAWTQGHGQDMLEAGAFSEELEELDGDTAFMLYRLADCGLEREALTDCFLRRSSGATCEELAVLAFDGEEAAGKAADGLRAYVEGQIQANVDYRPAEIPKLEGAWLEQRGNTLLFVVANDLETAKSAVGE